MGFKYVCFMTFEVDQTFLTATLAQLQNQLRDRIMIRTVFEMNIGLILAEL